MPDPADQAADIFTVQPELSVSAPEPRHGHLRVADDAQGDRLRKGHRAAHRQHGIPHPHRRRIPKCRRLKLARLVRLQPDDGNVRERIRAHEFGFDFFPVPQRAKHPFGVPRHVMVGDDIPVLCDDRPAANFLHLHLASLAVFRRDHADANESRSDLRDGRIDPGAQVRRIIPLLRYDGSLPANQDQPERQQQAPGQP